MPGPVPARVDAPVKEGLLKLVDEAVERGWPHVRACQLLEIADVRVPRWRTRLREHGTLTDRAPGGNAVHRLLVWEEQAILELIEQWGPIDRSHRKLAHRGSYLGLVFVSPSSVLRTAEKKQVELPGEPPAPPRPAPEFPAVPWQRNRMWMWDACVFEPARRVVYAIIDVVTRYWIAYLLTTEQTSTQVQLLFTHALEDQGLLDAATGEIRSRDGDDAAGPILVAWSDNGPEMTSGDTREFMALMTIAQGHGRPGTPTDQAHVEDFFSHPQGRLAPPGRHPRPRGAGRRTRPRAHGVEHDAAQRRGRLRYPRRRALQPRARHPPSPRRRTQARPPATPARENRKHRPESRP